jgi:hypothetical protein
VPFVVQLPAQPKPWPGMSPSHWKPSAGINVMAIRDHFRLDVLVRRAAALQELDAQLGEVERLLALGESASTGACGACGTMHGRGAVFC